MNVLERHVYLLAIELGDPSIEYIFMDDNAI